MSKKSRNKTELRKGKREPQKQKAGIERFLEYTRIFGLIMRPNKYRSKIKLVLMQSFVMIASIFILIVIYILYFDINSKEFSGQTYFNLIFLITIIVGIITLIRSIIAMYATLFRDYKGI